MLKGTKIAGSVVAFREHAVEDAFVALLFEKAGASVYMTPALTEPTDEMVNMKNLIVLQGYYRKSMDKFRHPTLFLLPGSEPRARAPDEKIPERHTVVFTGDLISYVLEELKVTCEHVRKVAAHIMAYADGDAAPQDSQLRHGLMALEGDSLLAKLRVLVEGDKGVYESTLAKGVEYLKLHADTFRARCGTSKAYTVKVEDMKLQGRVSLADERVVDTNLALLAAYEESDFALVLRSDLAEEKTSFSLRVRGGSTRDGVRPSGARLAAAIAECHKGSGGGGKRVGGGSVPGLWLPAQLLSPLMEPDKREDKKTDKDEVKSKRKRKLVIDVGVEDTVSDLRNRLNLLPPYSPLFMCFREGRGYPHSLFFSDVYFLPDVAKVVGVDMDDTVADLRGRLAELLPDHASEILACKDIDFTGDLEKKTREVMKQKGFYASLALIEGAARGIARLQSTGYYVCFVSSPLSHAPYCMQEKVEWVEKHFGHEMSRRIMLCSHKKLARVAYLIDDRPQGEDGLPEPSWKQIWAPTTTNEGRSPRLLADWSNLEECMQ